MPFWARLIVGVAALRVAAALTLYLSGQVPPPDWLPAPPWVYATIGIAYTVAGLGLVIGNRDDARAAWLGGVFTLVSVPLVTPLVDRTVTGALASLIYVRPEAFQGVFLWNFLARFPRELDGGFSRLARTAAAVSAFVGLVCATANLVAIGMPIDRGHSWWRMLLYTSQPDGVYWLLINIVTAPALIALIWRARVSERAARWQIRVFVLGLLLGLAPFAVEVLLESAWPAYRSFAHRPGVEPVIGAVLFGSLAIVPFVTAYSTLFDHVVELRVALQAAAQYALARYTILGATLVPFAALAVFLVGSREERIVSLLNGPRPWLLTSAIISGVTTLQLRPRWLTALDRRFFREPYDSRQILTRLMGDLQSMSAAELGARIQAEIERALHADVEVFFADETRQAFRHVDDRLPALGSPGLLSGRALAAAAPVDVDWRVAESLTQLADAERAWLASGRFTLLVGVREAKGGLAGLLALTSKQSGLPYSTDDRRFLTAVASAAGLALDSSRLRETPESLLTPAAKECLICSRLRSSDTVRCSCGGDVVVAAVPYVLRGAFRLEERIGKGSMGVVYRAVDLNLGRDVAIKALPRATPDHVARLRREARAMAAISHPNLAIIHGIETWQGTPFLIEEYLAGGTLAQRLARSRTTVREMLDLGIALAELLSHLHTNRVVHCDIKPSNIGFTRQGVPKLLDFGLARVLHEVQVASERTAPTSLDDAAGGYASHESVPGVGTPRYMSPEAVRGKRPAPSFDLWSLAVVLYEGLAGRTAFDGPDVVSILGQIVTANPPDIRSVRSDASAELAAFFEAALAKDPDRRPASADAISAELLRLRRLYG